MSEYEFAQKSALKLKGVSSGGIKKKKKSKSKTKEREEQALSNEASSSGSAEKKNKNQVGWKVLSKQNQEWNSISQEKRGIRSWTHSQERQWVA